MPTNVVMSGCSTFIWKVKRPAKIRTGGNPTQLPDADCTQGNLHNDTQRAANSALRVNK